MSTFDSNILQMRAMFSLGFIFFCHFIWCQDLSWFSYINGAQLLGGRSNLCVDSDNNVITSSEISDSTFAFMPYDSVSIDPLIVDNSSLLLRKMNNNGELLWHFLLTPSSGFIQHFDIITDPQNEIYLYGYLKGAIDFDPGPGELLIENNNSFVGFVAKYSSNNGGILWVKIISSSSFSEVRDMKIDDEGYLYLTGRFAHLTDLDTGEGNVYTPDGSYGSYVLKLSESGDYITSYFVNYSYNTVLFDNVFISANNVYISGLLTSSQDLDAGPDEYVVDVSGYSETFLCSFSLDLDFQSLVTFETTAGSSLIIENCEIDLFDNFILVGQLAGQADFDFSLGVTSIYSSNYGDLFIAKYNSDAELLWLRLFESSGGSDVNSICSSEDGSLYCAGILYNGSMDIDFSSDEFSFHSPNQHTGFVLKLSSQGDALWGRTLDTFGCSIGNEIALDDYGKIYVLANFKSNIDINLQESLLNLQLLDATNDAGSVLFKAEETECSLLAVQISQEGYSECSNVSLLSSSLFGGQGNFTYDWSGEVNSEDETVEVQNSGLVNLTVQDSSGCQASSSIYVSVPINDSTDVFFNLNPESFIPGYESDMVLSLMNRGCDQGVGSVKLILSEGTEFLYSQPEVDYWNGDTLLWYYDGLDFLNPAVFNVKVFVNNDVQIDDVLNFHVSVVDDSPLEIQGNNQASLAFEVDGNAIVNSMSVQPLGWLEEGYVLQNSELFYTIDFQNANVEGVDFVHIIDTLKYPILPNSIKIINASHPYLLEMLNDSILHISFDNINLSGLYNEVLSRGDITFGVEVDEDAYMNTEIINSAQIYFGCDYPVSTNLLANKVFDCSYLTASLDSSYEFNYGEPLIQPDFTFVSDYVWTLGEFVYDLNIDPDFQNLPFGYYELSLDVFNPFCSRSYSSELYVLVPNEQCSMDLDGNGIIGSQDVILFVGEFGCQTNCVVDFNQDLLTDINDLILLIENFGLFCEY